MSLARYITVFTIHLPGMAPFVCQPIYSYHASKDDAETAAAVEANRTMDYVECPVTYSVRKSRAGDPL